MKLRKALIGKLNDKEISLVNTSYDIIGNIAILDINEKLISKEKVIGNTLLELNKNIKIVLKKQGIHKGEYRIQKYKYICGEKKYETIYKENNCNFILDVNKVYFSPRLGNERLRISKLVKANENILVMFSGVGFYPIIISKNSKAKEIYGVELNKDACYYAKKNVSLNLVSNVHLYCEDIKNFKINKKFDRIIMPLPKDAYKFLNIAKKFIKKKGVIHIYTFSKEEEIENFKNKIKEVFSKFKILNYVKCGNFSPGIYMYCVDFKVP